MTQESARREQVFFTVVCVIAAAVVAGTYANSMHNALQFDDMHVVQQNLFIRSLGNIPRFFTDAATFSSLPLNATYRPLVSTSLALDYAIGGGLRDTFQFHLSQVLMLIGLGAMLTVLMRDVFDRAAPHPSNRYLALIAALFFCVHTANSETGNYISARSEILSTMGIAGSFLLYLHSPRARRTFLYLVPMLLGALAKTPAVMFAPLLFVYVLVFEHGVPFLSALSREYRAATWRALRTALPALVIGLAAFLLIEAQSTPTANYGGGGRLEYLRTQTFAWLHYARLFVLPMGLTADTDWKIIPSWYDTRVVAGICFAMVIAWMAARTSRHRACGPIAFGLAWFAIGLVPSSTIFPLAEVVNEHRIFLPYAGLVMAAAWWLSRQVLSEMARTTRPGLVGSVAYALTALLLFAHVRGTQARNTVWFSAETLWGDVVQKSPGNGRALMNYGLTKMARGDYAAAKSNFEAAQLLNPNYATLEINLGIVTGRLGDQARAEQHFLRALELQAGDVSSHFFYARWLVEQGRAREAIPHLQRGIALSPATVDSRILLMNVYAAAGADAELITLARETQQLAPDEPTARAYATGDVPIVVDPRTSAAYYARGVLLTNENDHLGAAIAYREALKLDAQNPDTHNNLGWSRAKLGLYAEAVPAFEVALRLRPDYTLAKNNLAWVRAQLTRVR